MVLSVRERFDFFLPVRWANSSSEAGKSSAIMRSRSRLPCRKDFGEGLGRWRTRHRWILCGELARGRARSPWSATSSRRRLADSESLSVVMRCTSLQGYQSNCIIIWEYLTQARSCGFPQGLTRPFNALSSCVASQRLKSCPDYRYKFVRGNLFTGSREPPRTCREPAIFVTVDPWLKLLLNPNQLV